MSLDHVFSKNHAIDAEGRFALYIEGINCAFSELQLLIEDGMIPRLVITLPATPVLRDLTTRARVHVCHREVVKDEWVVLMEAEILTRGFQKSPQSRDLTFVAYHVTIHFDQYAITALDPASANLVAMKGEDIGTPTIGTVLGNILDLFHPKAIVSELNSIKGAKRKVTEKTLTFADFVTGAFLRYQKLLDASRVANSYSHRAVGFHRLFDRILTPNPELIDWDEFYTRLMGMIFTQNAQPLGGRVSFFELLRLVAIHFLHQVSVVPNAESFKKQVQIKPQTVFNAIPRCNVIYSSMTDSYDFQEDWSTRPTRIEGHFLPVGSKEGSERGPLARYFTVYGPTELQWRWLSIGDKLKKSETTGAATIEYDQKTGELTAKPPKDGIPFLTLEEEQRGIVSIPHEIPRTLNAAIMDLVKNPAAQGADSPISEVASGQMTAHAYVALKSPEESDRIVKYRAFLCMALGDGKGIDPDKFSGIYPKRGETLVRVPASPDMEKLPRIVPERITYVGLKVHPQWNVGKKARAVRGHETLTATGANYFIDMDGRIIQVLPRQYHLFAEPRALPYGLYVPTLSSDDAIEINRKMPPFGTSTKASQTPDKFSALALGPEVRISYPAEKVFTLPWPEALTQAGYAEPAGKPGTPMNVLAFDVAKTIEALKALGRFGKYKLSQDAFDTIQIGDKATIHAFTESDSTPRTQTVTITDRFRTADSLWFKFDEPVCRKGYKHAISITSAPQINQATHSFRPWVLMTQPPEGGMKVSPVAKPLLDKIDNPIASKAMVTGGNDWNCVICFELANGKTMTPAQVKAAAFLTAVIKELGATKVGTLKAPKKSAAARELVIQDADIRQAREYYSKESVWLDLGKGNVAEIKSRASELQKKLFDDFTRWDTDLQKGEFTPLSSGATDTAEPPETSLTYNVSTTAQKAAAAGAYQSQSESLKTQIDEEDMGSFIDLYAGAIMNFQFYNQRFANQGFTAPMVFNPYLMVGYPCMLLDSSEASYHLLGYVHAVNHVITPRSAQTHATYSHVRRARYPEKILPYREPIEQFYNVRLADMKPFDLSSQKGKDEYHKTLKRMGLSMTTNLPIELLCISTKAERRGAEPPFVYHGGFGLGKKREADYSYYMNFLGFVDDNGKPSSWRDSDYLTFSDDLTLNFASDGDFIEGNEMGGELARLLDVDAKEALRRVYRRIQKVGQNDAEKAQASLVAFDGERKEDAVPERIKVYTQSPKFEDGKEIEAGKLFAFDTALQERVRTHTQQVKSKRAIVG